MKEKAADFFRQPVVIIILEIIVFGILKLDGANSESQGTFASIRLLCRSRVP
jgi:hypothetical protein